MVSKLVIIQRTLFLILLPPLGLPAMWIMGWWSIKFRIFITTLCIVLVRHLLILYMIFYGRFLYPEASMVLAHYCFGNGSVLNLPADYIKQSPVVIKHLNKMKTGERKRITAKQQEDYRLTFALNPFVMEKQKHRVSITQHIQFDTTGKVFTYIGPFRVNDNVVHVFNCTPFIARCEFKI
jgi:hypothetical protein